MGKLCAALVSAVCALSAAQPDFRNASWGMTQAQVLASEPGKPAQVAEISGEVVVTYTPADFEGMTARILYIFARDKLVRAKYLFDSDHAELNDFIADYRKLEPALRERHGKPAAERAIWEDDSTQLEPKSYLDQDRATPASILPSDPLVGLAVSLGHLRLYTRWETARTKTLHALAGGNRNIIHQLEFRSVEFEPLEAGVRH